MKEWYIERGDAGENHHARVRFVAHTSGYPIYELAKVWVWQHARRQGYGGRLLRLVCEDADREGALLRLIVSSFGDMDDRMLIQWYARHGFVRVGGFNMERYPKPIHSAFPGSKGESLAHQK